MILLGPLGPFLLVWGVSWRKAMDAQKGRHWTFYGVTLWNVGVGVTVSRKLIK